MKVYKGFLDEIILSLILIILITSLILPGQSKLANKTSQAYAAQAGSSTAASQNVNNANALPERVNEIPPPLPPKQAEQPNALAHPLPKLIGRPHSTAAVAPDGKTINQAASQNHWWDITYYSQNTNDYHGEFVAQANNINGLHSGDAVLVLPMNIALGTPSNLVWFQFSIQFDRSCLILCVQGVHWNLQDNVGATGCDSNVVYNINDISSSSPHTNGLSYTPSHSYHYDLYEDTSNGKEVFLVVDDTRGGIASGAYWWNEWSVPSHNLVYDASCFSPASAVEGYTAGATTSVSSVPLYVFAERTNIIGPTGFSISGTGEPIGMSQSMERIGSSGDSYWMMHQTGTALGTSLTLDPITDVRWGNQIAVSGTLSDAALPGGRINGATITFSGTGAKPLSATTLTDGTFSTTVTTGQFAATGLTVQAHFGGSNGRLSYLASDSNPTSYSQLAHRTSLGLAQPANVPPGSPTSFTTTLADLDSVGESMGGHVIHFDGTGAIGVADQLTSAAGTVIGTGVAPASVATGWTVQAHFGGDSNFLASNSNLATFSTTAVNQLALTITSPTNGAKITGPSSGVVVLVKGTTSDNNPVQKVEAVIDSKYPYQMATPNGPNDWSTWSYQYTFTSEGSHTITLKATDSAANVKKSTITINVSFASYPVTHMSDTTASGAVSLYAAKQMNTEYLTSTSQLVGKKIDSITVQLAKAGTPTGNVQIGVFNTDLSVKKLFGTKDASTLTTTSTNYTFQLTNNELYTMQAGDRIGVKFTGGSSTNYVLVMRDTQNTFDGTNSYKQFYNTVWNTNLDEDLYMILKQTHG